MDSSQTNQILKNPKFRAGLRVGQFIQFLFWIVVFLGLSASWIARIQVSPFRYLGY